MRVPLCLCETGGRPVTILNMAAIRYLFIYPSIYIYNTSLLAGDGWWARDDSEHCCHHMYIYIYIYIICS